MFPRSTLVVCFLPLLLPSGAAAATLRVPEDFPRIQAAIDAAESGDQIQVSPGTYHENLVVLGKPVTLVGTGGAAATIVDGGHSGGVLRIDGGVVDGFTLRNGYDLQGAGVYILCYAPITIRNCVIRDNSAQIVGGIDPDGWGGGMYILCGGSLLVENNVITANTAGGQGGGIFCQWGQGAVIRDNLISGNSSLYYAGGVYLNYGDLTTNRIVGNQTAGSGGGVYVATGTCNGNTIVGNSALEGNGVYAAGGTIARNVVAGNHGSYMNGDGGIDCQGGGVTLECNDSWGNDGGNFTLAGCDTTGKYDFSADPLFCGSDDYHLSTASPCLGLGVCGLIGALPAACGPTATHRVTWGALKSVFR